MKICPVCSRETQEKIVERVAKSVFRGVEVSYKRPSCKCEHCGALFQDGELVAQSIEKMRIKYESMLRT